MRFDCQTASNRAEQIDISSYTPEQLAMMYTVYYFGFENENDDVTTTTAIPKNTMNDISNNTGERHPRGPQRVPRSNSGTPRTLIDEIDCGDDDRRQKYAPSSSKNKKRKRNNSRFGTSTSKVVSSGPAEGLPPGWTLQQVKRTSGATKGLLDRYWFSETGKKFRSMKEVNLFLQCKDIVDGDEDEAYSILKNRSR
mmetsp:Transcript_9360/g.11555  ORF Transcript_9360/g.11555 Transcript_9360/m.11555 type:complete len:196 (+) Transcript_9360:27-614(+)